jgi:hypothetical protein
MDDNTLSDTDWKLIEHFKGRPHPLLGEVTLPPDLYGGFGELLQSARIVHHLLDLAGVPHGEIYSADLDARVLLLTRRTGRLQRLATLHQPNRNCDGHGGNSGYCMECDQPWPCLTADIVSGTRDHEI